MKWSTDQLIIIIIFKGKIIWAEIFSDPITKPRFLFLGTFTFSPVNALCYIENRWTCEYLPEIIDHCSFNV